MKNKVVCPTLIRILNYHILIETPEVEKKPHIEYGHWWIYSKLCNGLRNVNEEKEQVFEKSN